MWNLVLLITRGHRMTESLYSYFSLIVIIRFCNSRIICLSQNLFSRGSHWLHFDKLDLWILKMWSFNLWSWFSGTYLRSSFMSWISFRVFLFCRSMNFVTSVFFSKRCISYSLHIFWNQVVILSFSFFELLSRVVFMSLKSSSVDVEYTGSIHIELSVWKRCLIHFRFSDIFVVILLIFLSCLDVTYGISSFSNPIHSPDLRDPSPSFLVMSSIFFVIRHMLIPFVDALAFIADRFRIPVVLFQRRSS